jgi:hypothetical protein
MPTYEFTLERKETFTLEVEADDLEDAHVEADAVIEANRLVRHMGMHPDLEERVGSDDGWEILSVEPVAEEA